jgi:sigma-E factor negative regulatory protein RseC
MVTEEGIVQQISATKALILINRSSACAGCHSRSACMPSENKEMTVEAINDINAQVGDRVQVSVPTSSLLKATFLVYFVPVLALITGAITGNNIAPSLQIDPTLASMLCGFFAMGAVFGAVKWFDRGANSKTKYWPRVTRILPPLELLSCDNK